MAETTNTITSTTLQPEAKMVVPEATQDKTPYENIIQGALTGLPSLTAQVGSASKDRDTLLAGLVKNTGETLNKEQFAQDQQNLAGVTERQKELDALDAEFTDIGAQIKGLGRETSAVPLKVMQNNLGTGATEAGAAPQETAMLRENAIKALGLASRADILSARATNAESRLTRAKETAQKAVDLKYKPIESAITRIKDLLKINQDYILDPAEKKLAEKQTIALNERERVLKEKKQDEKDISDLLINAESQLAPADVISRAKSVITNGGTKKDVIYTLGKYAGEYQKALLLQEQIKKTRAEANKEAGIGSGAGVAGGAVTSSAKNWLAQYNSGAMSLEDIYTKIGSTKEAGVLKNEVARLVADQGGKRKYGADDASVQAIKSQIENVNTLLTGNKYKGIVGFVQGGLGIVPDSLNVFKQDALATAKNLVSNQTLQALADAKSKGVTFGALSEGELGLVSDSASRVASKLIKDKEGNITGFSGSEGDFFKDLNTIKSGLEKSIESKTMTPPANKFNMSLGVQSSSPIMGTEIIKDVSSSGSIEFDIPKPNKKK